MWQLPQRPGLDSLLLLSSGLRHRPQLIVIEFELPNDSSMRHLKLNCSFRPFLDRFVLDFYLIFDELHAWRWGIPRPVMVQRPTGAA